jgi:hypothetical protein
MASLARAVMRPWDSPMNNAVTDCSVKAKHQVTSVGSI